MILENLQKALIFQLIAFSIWKHPPKGPLEIKRGNVTVKIYAGTNRVAGKDYPQFTLTYYSGNQRIKKRFADLEEAKREGALAATRLANGEHEVLRLSSTDRTIYLQASEVLKPLNTPLNVAVNEYVSAVNLLPKGATLREAVDFFTRRNPASLPAKTVRAVVDELVPPKAKPVGAIFT